ncbi:Predicted metal-dependent hydrolase of the TIM-barrel fold [Achromobacter spanius]|uniref:amidohydrolase family protein n=1 Tax=Achromobacter spanius TaxID=217203 RepID=UPI000C2BDD12|nr:amidohydrolase family protein [Achromobacter spanius]AUA56627.1 amidohydrolase [Achromobacter spanius]CAB3644539.1 2-pyrone-4,6-dicarbaxylate hydrolase [Achromobacter spanius]SPT37842.1 Predicted metal-dependent hydrolase of the TIM-barrel fold [Achromobacter denitrificans]VEE55777.1 Predicted metal-dependent hydrolase of the TIM-barrel fold [Achromobacter spanius]
MSAPFPYSAGLASAAVAVPDGACDCHIHAYDARYPAVPGARLLPPDATMQQYRAIQARLGTQRAVLVTPSTYGADNRSMLSALAELGGQARGVAVIDGLETDAQLQALHAAGVRGIRFNLSLGVVNAVAQIGPLAARVAPLGWHVQLLMPPDQLVQISDVLARLPTPLVFDHMARIAPNQAGAHPAHALVLQWLGAGRAWVKLSGGYLVSEQRSVQDPALDDLARSFIDANPDRVIWGSDWPHASASAGMQPMPDDARQLERLAEWTQTDATLQRVLVQNPAALYGFPA